MFKLLINIRQDIAKKTNICALCNNTPQLNSPEHCLFTYSAQVFCISIAKYSDSFSICMHCYIPIHIFKWIIQEKIKLRKGGSLTSSPAYIWWPLNVIYLRRINIPNFTIVALPARLVHEFYPSFTKGKTLFG